MTLAPNIWYNYSFRNTVSGAATWDTGALLATGSYAGWDPLVSYAAGDQSQWAGVVYTATSAAGNLNKQPPNATYWTVVGYTDPVDANNITTVLPASTAFATYPTANRNNSANYGKSNGPNWAGTDASKTNAGSEPLLAGSNNLTSTAMAIQFDGPSGTYDVRLALGPASTGGPVAAMIVEGTAATLLSDVGSLNIGFWTAASVVNTSTYIVSKTDKSIWKCTTGGTTATPGVEPSGAGPTFTESTGVVWTKTGRSALAVINQSSGSAGGVVDQNGTPVLVANWKSGAPITLSISSTATCFTLLKVNGVNLYVRQFGMRLQGYSLADVTLNDEFGQAAPAPTIYCNQPAGEQALRINATGAYTAAAFSFGGDLGPYFTSTLIGGFVYAVHNGLRIPDSLAGTRALQIIQTDAGAASGSPHTTTINCTVVATQGRPTDTSNVLGLITSQTWLGRYVVKSAHGVSLWPGYQGQALTDVGSPVTSKDELVAAINGLAPNGTSWYRIKLGAGTFVGKYETLIAKDFGSGGLLIEPAAGADPEVNCALTVLQICGLHVRNVKLVGDKSSAAMNTSYQFNFTDPGPTGIGGGGRFNRFKLENCRVGFLFGAGNDISQHSAKAGFCVGMTHGESFEAVGCTVLGSSSVFLINGVRAVKITGNDFQKLDKDVLGIGSSYTWLGTSTTGVFPDDHVYLDFSDNTIWNEPDSATYAPAGHADTVQAYRSGQNAYRWFAGMTATNGYGQGLNVICLEDSPPSIWKLTNANGTTSATAGSQPLGAGPTFNAPDGTVWTRQGTAIRNKMFILMENITEQSQGPLSGQNARQFFLDSNPNHSVETRITVINCLMGSDSAYGIQSGGFGVINAEFNTFIPSAQQVAAPAWSSTTTYTVGQKVFYNGGFYQATSAAGNLNQIPSTPNSTFWTVLVSPTTANAHTDGNGYAAAGEKGYVRARYNVMRSPSVAQNPNVNTPSAGAYSSVVGEVIIPVSTWTGGGGDPNTTLVGPFVQDSNAFWTYPSLVDDGSVSAAQFRAQFRAMAKVKSGIAGIFADQGSPSTTPPSFGVFNWAHVQLADAKFDATRGGRRRRH